MGGESVIVFGEYTIRIQWDVNDNPIYVGWAMPGTLTSVTEWRIMRITWVAGNPTEVEWAEGQSSFSYEWDERAAYAYS